MMRRGEVWVASFRPWRGREVGKTRPSVILQADPLITADSETILALPMTTQLRRDTEPLRVPVSARDRLKRPSYIMVEKMRALDRDYFGEGPITTLTSEEMAAVEKSLKAVLGFL